MPKKIDKTEKKETEEIKKDVKKDKSVELDAKDTNLEEISETEDTTEEIKEVKEHKSVKPNVKKNVHGKKYQKVANIIEKGKDYDIDEAITLLKKTATTKFDSSIEIHMNLNVDLTNPEQQVRGSVSMPQGLGKSKKICAIVGADKEKEAKDAGAENIGGQDLIEKIEKGWMDFDVVVATPDMMPHIGKIGKILGTKGLMPNPKTGTVTPEVGKIILEIKKGKADFRVDSSGTIHAAVGKVSFDDAKIKENVEAFISTIHNSKPTSVRGTFVKSIFLTTTMGPSVKLSDK